MRPCVGLHRIRSSSVCTDTDGVDPDSELFGYLGSRQWRNISTVIATIRQQNNHFRFRLAVLQTGHRIGNAHADGSTIFNQSALGDIAFDAVEQIQQHPMVYR